MFKRFTSLFAPKTARNDSKRRAAIRRRCRRWQPTCELLEDRALPSASAYIAGGYLFVFGDDVKNDSINLYSTDNINAKVDIYDRTTGQLELSQSFALSQFQKIIINGQGGNDLLSNGLTLGATMLGGAGHDYIYGSSSGDVIDGGAGTNVLAGRGGDDTYSFLVPGTNTIYEAANGGIDTLDFSGYSQGVTVYLNKTTLQTLAPGLSLKLGSDTAIENVIGSQYKDIITGNSSANLLRGLDGSDYLFGQAGADVLDGGLGIDWLQGDNGGDRYVFGPDASGTDYLIEFYDYGNLDTLDFSAFQHGITLNLGQLATTYPAAGQAVAPGLNLVIEQEGAAVSNFENVIGSPYADVIYGTSLGNYLQGLGGNDSLYGLAGPDHLEGGYGDDYLEGGADFDYYEFGCEAGNLGHDTIHDTSANNELDFFRFGAGAHVDLASNAFQTVSSGRLSLTLKDPNYMTYVIGSQFDDNILGNGRNNYIDGQAGNDILSGLGGNDALYGGTGKDTLIGGTGNDYLNGGNDGLADYLEGDTGADTFAAEWYTVFNLKRNRDYPADFHGAEGDKVV